MAVWDWLMTGDNFGNVYLGTLCLVGIVCFVCSSRELSITGKE
jgi:hypothetical protein